MKINYLFSGRILTISNVLSLSRIFLAPLVAYSLFAENESGDLFYRYAALAILVVIILTDYLDGMIARRLNQVSRLGQFLDPIADKIAIYILCLLLWHYRNFPIWIIAVLFLRDMVAIIGGFLIFSKKDVQVRPNFFGKAMVTSMGAAGVLYLMSPEFSILGVTLQEISIYLTLVFLLLSSAVFMKMYFRVYFDGSGKADDGHA
jgi:CDP-diacylglycerol---glycerol-3-phosphate 3-phosphatidyltransferase